VLCEKDGKRTKQNRSILNKRIEKINGLRILTLINIEGIVVKWEHWGIILLIFQAGIPQSR